MNNKGQVLVVFVIVIPLIILLLMYVADYGMLQYKKVSAEREIKYIMKDSLKNNYTSDTITDLVRKNIDDLNDLNVNITSSVLSISLSIKYDGIMFNRNQIININYNGNYSTKEIKKG